MTDKVIKALLIILVLAFPLGQFSQIASVDNSNLYLPDILVATIIIFWISNGLLRKRINLTYLSGSFLGFFLSLLLSLSANFLDLTKQQLFISSLYLLRFISYASLYFVISDLVDHKIITKEFILNGLIFSGVCLAIIGIEQYLLFPDMRVLKYLGWDDHYFRIISTFLDPNFSGIVFSAATISIIGQYLLGKKSAIAILPITTLALFLTYSRTAYLSFIIGVTYLLISFKRTKLLLTMIILFMLVLLILPRGSGGEGVKLERVNSFLGRLDSMKQSLRVFSVHPITGIGFNAYKFVGDKNPASHSSSGVENSYLFVLATTGIVGVIAFLNLILNFSYYAKSKMKNTEGIFKGSTIIFVSILISLLISALSVNSLFYPWIMIWIFPIMALV